MSYLMFYFIVACRECGGNLTDDYGMIDFLSISDTHDPLDCYWSIYGNNETVIQLDIMFMDINYHEDCSHDYLEVLLI